MHKTVLIPEDAKDSGIYVAWTPADGRIVIGGWYDSLVDLEPGSMTLAELFVKLGITEKDVMKAFANAKQCSCGEPVQWAGSISCSACDAEARSDADGNYEESEE